MKTSKIKEQNAKKNSISHKGYISTVGEGGGDTSKKKS